MSHELEIKAAGKDARRVSLDKDSFSVGRAHSNDLCYPDDASLSRNHMVLEKRDDHWWVTDLRSKNGTLLNGARITGWHRLHPGDRLSLGQLIAVFLDPTLGTEENVVFVPQAGRALSPGATVMASLEGLLSSDSTGQAAEGPELVDARDVFQLPVVRALIRAGRELAGAQPLEELFELILALSIEAVNAERGVLMTLESSGLVPRAVHGDGFRISTTVRDRVLEKKESLLVQDVDQEEALQNQMSIAGQQIHSLMAVPLQTQDEVIGLVYVDSRRFVREFTADDLNLLTVLSNVAAIRIDHERHLRLQQQEQRRTRDLQQAAEIQRSLLPTGAPAVDGLDVAGYNAPCRTVGGDYYDFIPYPDGRLGLVLGDVAGKGMSAALLMSSLQAYVQLLTELPLDLATMTSRLDRSIASRCPSNRFITFFVALVDPTTGKTDYCNAGHNPALVLRASGEVEELGSLGTALAMLPQFGYQSREIELAPGDLLAVYSDGVTEATGAADPDAEFGVERLADVLRAKRLESSATIVSAVNRALDEWTSSAPAEDDVTLVVARRVPIQ
jgi:serine phosphatase RsbU (regulator of sigma subunit)